MSEWSFLDKQQTHNKHTTTDITIGKKVDRHKQDKEHFPNRKLKKCRKK